MGTGDEEKTGKQPRPQRDGVSHDARGNAVWQWAVDSGRHLMESTSQLMKRLEVPGLKLEDDAGAQNKEAEVPRGAPAGPKANAGYDPYGGRRAAPTSAAHSAPAARPPPAVRPVVKKPAAVPPPDRSWWRRLFRQD